LSGPLIADHHEGQGLLRASWIGTGVYVASAALTLVAEATFGTVMLVVSVVLFLLGLGAFFAAYARAISRSREDLIGIGGLYFLAGIAPVRVQRNLLGSLAVQVVVATVTASIGLAKMGSASDATNALAYGILTPMYGLGLAGLWGARFGTFAPRPVDPPSSTRRGRVTPD